jgi:hypothetical protein
MKKSQHVAVRFTVDLEIIKTVAAWGKPSTLEPVIGMGLRDFQKLCCPMAEQNAMAKFVNRVLQI